MEAHWPMKHRVWHKEQKELVEKRIEGTMVHGGK